MSKLIYILGCDKSGTLLLSNYLRCAKGVVTINGEVPPMVLFRAKELYPDSTIVARRCSPTSNGPAVPNMWGTSFSGSSILTTGSRKTSQGTKLFDRPYTYVPWVEWLVGGLSEVIYIHMRRDPRDALTCMNVPRTSISIWKNAERVRSTLQKAGATVHVVAYEDLVKDPEKTLATLFPKLELTQEVSLNDWKTRLHPTEEKSPAVIWHKTNENEDKVGCWQATDKTKAITRAALSANPDLPDLLIEYGYETGKDWTS